MNSKLKRFCLSGLTLGTAFATGPLAAQQGGLEEIIVTAEFRKADVQDTPISITAISSEMMDARSQTSVFEIAAQAPNVTLKPAGAAFGPAMIAFIRGIGQYDFIFAVEPGVGIYVDDVYYSTLTGSLLDLLDLDRVEVLRGPQGTLAGRNSIGGAVKLYSKAPGEENGGNIQLTYGSYDRVEGRASADFTIVPDRLFARASAVGRVRDGYIDVLDYACTHPGSGAPTLRRSDGCKLDEMGDQNYAAGRLSLRWLASDDVEVNVSADVLNDNSGTGAGTLLYGHNPGMVDDPATATVGDMVPRHRIDDGNPATPPVGYQNHIFVPYGPWHNANDPINDPYVNYATLLDNVPANLNNPTLPNVSWKPVQLDSANTLDMWGISGKIDWRLNDSFSLTSITAYRWYESVFNVDSDYSPVPITLVGSTVEHEQTSQELRLNGTIGMADFTVGGFYFDQNNFYQARVDLNYTQSASAPYGLDFIHGPDPTPSTTWALFGHTTLHLTDRLNLSGGVRYSDDEKDYMHQRHNPDGTVPGASPNPNYSVGAVNGLVDQFRGTRWDWRVALDYAWTDDIMTYAQVSTGYKGGGVNPRPFFPEQLKSFEPETLTAYEIGFKSALFDRRMRLNGSVFYNDYENIQLNLSSCERPSPPFPTPTGAPCAAPRNVGNAKMKGAELETEIYPTDALMIDASASYLDFDYKEVDAAALNGSETIANKLDMVTPYTPKWKWSGGVQYTFPETSLGTFSARVDANYQSMIYTNPTNDKYNRIDDYTLYNARLMWRSTEEVWSAALEIANFTDKLYYLAVFDQHQGTSVGQVTGAPGLPRTWAFTIRRNF